MAAEFGYCNHEITRFRSFLECQEKVITSSMGTLPGSREIYEGRKWQKAPFQITWVLDS